MNTLLEIGLGILVLIGVIFGVALFLDNLDSSKDFYCCNEEGAWKENPCWAHEESWCTRLGNDPSGKECEQVCFEHNFETGKMTGFTEGEWLLFRYKCVCEGTLDTTPQGEEMTVEQKCIDICSSEVMNGAVLTNGPCLSNNVQEDWVCDVAHKPRNADDEKSENQCSEYGKTAHHFVEVSPECELIRSV